MTALLRAAAIALVVVAGCGGGGDATPPGTTIDLSRSETIKAPATATSDGSTSSLGAKIAFFAIAALVLLGALATILSRNAVNAVMSLVATFFALAALYTLLSAHFLAAIQVLVYAGAIMTLFVFVVMLLNREENQPWAPRGIIMRAAGSGLAGYTMVIIGNALRGWQPQKFGADRAELPTGDGGNAWGGVARVGEVLFKDYLFPFEAISLLLLVAVIGAVVVARIPRRRADEEPTAPHVEEGEHA